jgi:hypothetical protein
VPTSARELRRGAARRRLSASTRIASITPSLAHWEPVGAAVIAARCTALSTDGVLATFSGLTPPRVPTDCPRSDRDRRRRDRRWWLVADRGAAYRWLDRP